MKNLLTLILIISVIGFGALEAAGATKKIVLIAGVKSHGPGDHEYEKGCLLLKQCLDSASNVKGVITEVYTNGWPSDPKVLESASTILLYSDGSDHSVAAHPILAGDRLEQIDALMKKGVGFVALHYTVFVPSQRGGKEFLEWIGGYFDYENGTAPNKWFSTIETKEYQVRPATPDHPITQGVAPFRIREEYYYRMRFKADDRRWKPVLTFGSDVDRVNVVGWSVERPDGGRGFGYTGGHFHSNWENDSARRLILNALLWTAKIEVPKLGVQSSLQTPRAEVRKKALIVTGYNGPFHDWKQTTMALKEVLTPSFDVTVSEDPEVLAKPELQEFDLLVQNYVNWDKPSISPEARNNFVRFLNSGKGVSLIHFANGAFRDWPEYQKISRRVWVDGKSAHDAHGPFRVSPTSVKHWITEGLSPFETVDELYFNQQGEEPIEALVVAKSNVTGRDEPMAFAYSYGEGRVFQTLLGHDGPSVRAAGKLILRGSEWAARPSDH